jgi:hypothetical protein
MSLLSIKMALLMVQTSLLIWQYLLYVYEVILEMMGDNYCKSFKAFMVMMFQVEIFWVVTPCNVVVGYQCFRGPYCFYIQGEGSMAL